MLIGNDLNIDCGYGIYKCIYEQINHFLRDIEEEQYVVQNILNLNSS